MRQCLLPLALLLVTSLAPAAAKEPPQKTFSDAACGYAFDFPAQFRVEVVERVGCDVTLAFQQRRRVRRNTAWKTVHTLWIKAFDGDFEAGAKESGFERGDNGVWVALGRQGAQVTADNVAGGQWRGLRASPPVGCFNVPGGHYSGLSDYDFAFLNNGGGRSIRLDAGVCPSDAESLDLVLPSFRFLPRPQARLIDGAGGSATTSSDDEYQGYFCPQTHAMKVYPDERYWLEGTIGGEKARMYLNRGGDGVVGVFYFLRDWKPIFLGGEWRSNSEITVNEYTDGLPNLDATGARLQGRFSGEQLVGAWTSREGATQPVQLTVGLPPTCDLKEPWQRFDDRRWPITFKYPACLHLEVTDKEITVTHPDPIGMIYAGQETWISKSKRRERLQKCGDTWRYGPGCTCTDDTFSCPEASVRRVHGFTVADLHHLEWRIYCRVGGYQGQGEGTDQRIFVDDTEITIINGRDIAQAVRKRR